MFDGYNIFNLPYNNGGSRRSTVKTVQRNNVKRKEGLKLAAKTATFQREELRQNAELIHIRDKYNEQNHPIGEEIAGYIAKPFDLLGLGGIVKMGIQAIGQEFGANMGKEPTFDEAMNIGFQTVAAFSHLPINRAGGTIASGIGGIASNILGGGRRRTLQNRVEEVFDEDQTPMDGIHPEQLPYTNTMWARQAINGIYSDMTAPIKNATRNLPSWKQTKLIASGFPDLLSGYNFPSLPSEPIFNGFESLGPVDYNRYQKKSILRWGTEELIKEHFVPDFLKPRKPKKLEIESFYEIPITPKPPLTPVPDKRFGETKYTRKSRNSGFKLYDSSRYYQDDDREWI